MLPGDEKAKAESAGAPTLAAAPSGPAPQNVKTPAETPKTTDSPADTGAGEEAEEEAREEARKSSHDKAVNQVLKESDAPDPKPKNTGPRRPGGGAG